MGLKVMRYVSRGWQERGPGMDVHRFLPLLVLLLMVSVLPPAHGADCAPALDFTVHTLVDNKPVHLCEQWQGKVVVIVNTASKCGYTPQYEGLEALYETYREQGLVILGFPSNDFGGQEPGTAGEIATFCKNTYGVLFPMYKKSNVAQRHADPLYRYLGERAGGYPRWNFHKYLLNRKGELVGSYASQFTPKQLEAKIVPLLSEQP